MFSVLNAFIRLGIMAASELLSDATPDDHRPETSTSYMKSNRRVDLAATHSQTRTEKIGSWDMNICLATSTPTALVPLQSNSL